MSEARIYIPEDMRREIEALRLKFGDEKLTQTGRRIMRAGLEKLKAEAQ